MKMILTIIFILFCFPSYSEQTFSGNLTLSGGQGSASQNKLLLPIGDSITRGVLGDTDDFGYRNHLQDQLGISTYNFVGQYNDGTSSLYQTAHSGVNSQVISQIKTRLGTDLTSYMQGVGYDPKQIILIHAGTNDLVACVSCSGAQVDAAVAAVSTLVDDIVARNPAIDVYVAKLVPSKISARDTDITSFNTKLATMVSNYGKTNLYIVDMNAAFKNDTFGFCSGDWSNNCMGDQTHPNNLGYKTMAYQWASCIGSTTATNCNGN